MSEESEVEIKHIRERSQKMEATIKKLTDTLKEVRETLDKTISEIENTGTEPTKNP